MRRGKRRDELEKKLAEANEKLVAITRAINPVLYTMVERYEQDTYGLSYLEKSIPFLQPANDLAKMKADSPEFKALHTQLTRARNRVGDALDQAARIAEDALQLIS
jgi:hypothetical protein